MKAIKILIVTASMNVGGLENQLMHLLRNADKSKYQIDFSSKKSDAFFRNEIEGLGGTFYVLPEMTHRNIISYFKRLVQIMKDGEYDVVHSNELFHSGIVMLAAYVAGVKHRIAHSHSIYDLSDINQKRSFMRNIYCFIMRRLILGFSTLQIACSTSAGKFLFGENIVEKNSFRLIFNSVDTLDYIKNYEKKENGELIEPGWVNVLHVGRVCKVKNQIFLTEIADEFKRRSKKIRIICVGSGDKEYRDQLNKAIKEKQLEDYMLLTGVRKDIDALLRKASAFVLPSLYEGMPLVLIEAQASGIHCVSANTFSKEVDFGTNSIEWLSLQDGSEKWADALERAIDKGRVDKNKIIDAIKEKGFDSRVFAQKMCKIYCDSIRKRG